MTAAPERGEQTGPATPHATQPAPGAGLGRTLSAERFPTTDLVSKDTLLDSGLPTIVFITAYSVTRDVTVPLVASLVAGVALAGYRLAKRATLQNVAAGFVGLLVCAWFAQRSGRAEDFFKPGLYINAGYAVAYLASILARRPLLGIFVGLATGEGMGWLKHPGLLRAYTIASWFWVAMFGLRLIVQVPLYLAGETVALGVARLAMGWPLFFLCAYLSWIVIRNARRDYLRVSATAAPAAAADGD